MNITIQGFVQDRGLLPARGGRMRPHMMECYSDVTMTEWTQPTQNMPQHLGCPAHSLAAIHSAAASSYPSHSLLRTIIGSQNSNVSLREPRCNMWWLETWSLIVYDDVESALASVSPSVEADVYGVCTLYFNRWMLGYGFSGMHLNKYLGAELIFHTIKEKGKCLSPELLYINWRINDKGREWLRPFRKV